MDDSREINGKPVKLNVQALKDALKLDENRTKTVLEVIYQAAPWARNSSSFPEQRKEDAIRVLLFHMLNLDIPERTLLAGEIVKIAGEVETKKVPLVLLDPDMGRWYSIMTGEYRTSAALEILKNNPRILQNASAAKEILVAAQKTCYDLNSHSSIARIAEIVAMTGDPGQRDHMIRHLRSGFAPKESASALGALRYLSFEDAIPAILALNRLWATRTGDAQITVAAEQAIRNITDALPSKLVWTANITLEPNFNAVLEKTGVGWLDRVRTRSVINNSGANNLQELRYQLARLIRDRHPLQRGTAQRVIRATEKLVSQ